MIICLRFVDTSAGEAEPCQQWNWNFCKPPDRIINPVATFPHVAAEEGDEERKARSAAAICQLWNCSMEICGLFQPMPMGW